ncbi:hypothetical protein DW1_2185 [Proteiniborus sp. DW1]|uniref:ABC-2 transporter permease n=1 Tax=Proteiniborus sp. DW1 TaxID=1889883 RepID=UPI00092DF48C|nr:ABC-2 transporter permease [Proteiniborus sp. DW1]SCG83750.1 hypothetical protein DW1_2185 [Proteiniborus sp. DW1]
MQGLIIKDFIAYSRKNVSFLKVLIIYAPLLFLIFLVDNVEFIKMMINSVNLPIAMMTICIDLREIDRKYNVDKRVITYPISRAKIVLSRYLSVFSISLISIACTVILNIFLILMKGTVLSTVILSFLNGLFIGIIIFAFTAVIAYTSSTVMNGFVMLLVLAGYLFYIFNHDLVHTFLNTAITWSASYLTILLGVFSLGCIIISYMVSLRTYYTSNI